MAFADLRTFVSWGPDGVRLEPSATLTPAQARVVCLVSQTVIKDGGTLRLKLHDKIAALDKLARHLGLYTGHAPEDALGTGMFGLKQAIEARQELLSRLKALAEKARENGQGEADGNASGNGSR